MSVAGYPDYTDSGVEWVGLMPAHWEVKRLRYCASLVTIKATESDWQIGLENIAGWTGRFVETEAEFAGDGTAFERSDILYGKLRPYLAKVLVAERPGQAVGDFHVLRPRPTSMSAFLARQLLTRELVSRIDGSTHGSKMPRASWETLADISLPVPPLPEQIAIATFLDRETGKIDALVEEQRRLIALLKEKRQAVISHAVTKGLNPNAPMKDSGIEWLGEVPAHWEVCKLGYAAKLQSGFAFASDDFQPAGTPIVRMNNLNRGRLELGEAVCVADSNVNDKVALTTGDLLWGMSGSIGETGSLGNFARVSV
jgi:type I restriction enzyme S subunit